MVPNTTIIGSGITGLLLAYDLQTYGMQALVIDKGHKPGGRLASKALNKELLIDSGSRWFQSPRLNRHSLVQKCLSEINAEKMDPARFSEHARHLLRHHSENEIWQLNTSFRSFSQKLAESSTVSQGLTLKKVEKAGTQWLMTLQPSNGLPCTTIETQNLVLTMPWPQVAELLNNSGLATQELIRQSSERIRYEPALVALLRLRTTQDYSQTPNFLTFSGDSVLQICHWGPLDDGSDEIWAYLECSPEFSKKQWDESPDTVLEAIKTTASNPFGLNAEVLDSIFHRWKYARIKPESECFPEPIIIQEQPLLLVAGEAFGVKPGHPAGIVSAQHSAKFASEFILQLTRNH
jgi:predicted NAD/FAD-dependent oxidoreductase